jgi:hypothetical protein
VLAVLQRRFVRHNYKTLSGRTEEGVLAPYAMLLYKNGMYVLGPVVDEKTLGTPKVQYLREPGLYAVERFRAIELVSRFRRRNYLAHRHLACQGRTAVINS